MGDAVEPFSSTAELLLSASKAGRAGWACLRPEEQPKMVDLQGVLSCSRTDAAFRKLLHVLKAPAEYHQAGTSVRDQRYCDGMHAHSCDQECAELGIQRNRLQKEIAAMRQELSCCQDEMRIHQSRAEGAQRDREKLTKSCDVARRQLVHLCGHRCKMKRAAGVIRGSAGQLQLHDLYDALADQAVQRTIRQHLLELVRRSFTAEGTLIDESLRFLRGGGATLQRLVVTLCQLLAESCEQLRTRHADVPQRAVTNSSSEVDTTNADQQAAKRKMRALLTLAHGQHLAAYEEVEMLRIEAHEAQQRAEGLAVQVDTQLSQVAMSDSEWRVTNIAMKQDRDLAAAHASVRVVQSRLNDMKIKVQMGQQTSDRLRGQRMRLRCLESDIREARWRAAGLSTDSKRIFKLVCDRNCDLARFCDSDIARGSTALRQASDVARQALRHHPLRHALILQPAEDTRQDALVDEDGRQAGWSAAAHAVTQTLHLTHATSDHLVLQRAADAVLRGEGTAACSKFAMASRDAVVARTAASSWNSAPALAKLSTSLDAWDARWKRIVEEELRVAARTGMDAVERGAKLEELVTECHQQPAQFAAPWVQVLGKNMHEWSLYLRSTEH